MYNASLANLAKQITNATSLKELKQSHNRVYGVLEKEKTTLTPENSLLFYRDINTLHMKLMIEAIKLAELEVDEKCIGLRPKRCCWYLLGSGARQEQTVWTDQDNGIIYECESEDYLSCRAYIRAFAETGTDYLNEIGFAYCDGNIMATNERWAKEKEELLFDIKRYVMNHLPEDISYLYMLSDIKAIYGDEQLIHEVKQDLHDVINESKETRRLLREHVSKPTVPLGAFGQIFTERWGENSGQVDIKYGVYVPIVNSVKCLSLISHGHQMTTLSRLKELKEQHVITDETYYSIYSGFITILYFRLKISIVKSASEYHVLFKYLTKEDRFILKKAMKAAKKIQHIALHWRSEQDE